MFFLAKQYQAMEGGLAARRFALRISDPLKIHGGIFRGDIRRRGGARDALPAVPCKHIKQGTKPPRSFSVQLHFKRQPVMEPEGGTPKGR